MFRAAFTSRSWTVPHAAHVHSRTASGLGPSFTPHAEHTWSWARTGRSGGTCARTGLPSPQSAAAAATTPRQLPTWPAVSGPARTRRGPRRRPLGCRGPAAAPSCARDRAGFPHLAVQHRHPAARLVPVRRALPLARQRPLRPGQAPRSFPQEPRVRDYLAIRGDRQSSRPTSMPISPSQAGNGRVPLHHERGVVPAVCLLDHGDRRWDRRQRPGPLTRSSPTFATYSRSPCRANPLRVSRIDWRPRLERNRGRPALRPFRFLAMESNQFRYARRASCTPGPARPTRPQKARPVPACAWPG